MNVVVQRVLFLQLSTMNALKTTVIIVTHVFQTLFLPTRILPTVIILFQVFLMSILPTRILILPTVINMMR